MDLRTPSDLLMLLYALVALAVLFGGAFASSARSWLRAPREERVRDLRTIVPYVAILVLIVVIAVSFATSCANCAERCQGDPTCLQLCRGPSARSGI